MQVNLQFFFFLMLRRPPRSTRTDTLFPYTTLFRSYAEIGRNVAWILLVFRLFANDGRDESMGTVRPVVVALAFVELLQLPLLMVRIEYADNPGLEVLAFEISAMLRMMAAIGALVLLQNLYVGRSEERRVGEEGVS